MGRLTEDATRLCAQIAGLRDARLGFVQGLRDTVSEMLASFRNAHSEMAKRAGAERDAFLTNLAGMVAGLRQECTADLAGARSAWAAVTRPGRPARQSEAQRQGKGRSRNKSRSGR